MENPEKPKKHSAELPPERFQPKVLFIWLLIVAIIMGLWSLFPDQAAITQKWSINEVLQASDNGRVISGSIKADVSRGSEWYIVKGEAKNPAYKGADLAEGEVAIPQTIFFEAEGRLTPQRYNELVDPEKGGFVFAEVPGSTFWMELIAGLLPFLIIVGVLYFLFVRQLRMAGKGAMSFGKSKARLLTRERDKITFKDVAGCDEAKEEVSEIVDFLRDPKKFNNIGGKIPKGVLLVGAPGTGKTLLAKAVAGEADVPFFTISGSDFVEMFVGVGAARVRDMFEQARKNAPCIIFIDEIDAVGRQRGAGLGGGNDEREQTLNSLLVEMDGFDGHEGVIVIAATNRPDVLDSALLRPGRFDRQVTVDLPDLIGREEILKVHAKKIKLDKDVALRVVARSTPGFSGADLENLLNEGALLAARENKKKVSQYHLEEAREKISFGRERRKLMDAEDKKITAVHEAGHALVQAVIDDGSLPVHKVTIIPRGQSLGSTMFVPKKDVLNQAKSRALNQICCMMGGRIAEEIVLGDITSGASGDIRSATKLARHMVCDWGMSDLGPLAFGENQEHIFLGREIARQQNYSEDTAQKIDKAISKIVDEQYQRATDVIKTHRKALDKITEALLEYETIEGKHVHEILETGEIQSEVMKTSFTSEPEPEAEPKKKDKKVSRKNEGEAGLETSPVASS